jgi:uncharacterized protein YbgA (DUF1722 family)
MKYSLDCARLSAIVYKNDSDAHSEINSLYEVTDFTFFDRKGTQALSFISNNKLFICFRGTEPTKFSDIAADLKAWQLQDSKYKTGKVHAGFKAALDAVWPTMLPYLEKHVGEVQKVEVRDIFLNYDRSLLVADSRTIEPKKFGGKGARSKYQKSYR